jgi:SMC interacting uncharacterized protein involved in chromosome segregation
MTFDQLEQLKEQIRAKFVEIDNMSPMAEPSDSWENARWELEKIECYIDSMIRSVEDIIFDSQRIIKSLDNIGEVVRAKIENPYSQQDFI